MRVLHVIESLEKGGAERLVINICNGLEKLNNVQTHILIFRNNNEYQFLCDNLKITHIPVFFNRSLLRKNKEDNLVKFDSFINDFNPNIIHSHLRTADIISRLKIKKNISYFSHLHDNYFLNMNRNNIKTRIVSYLDNIWIQKLYEKANNNFIAISDEFNMYYKKKLSIINRENISILYNCIDYDRFLGKPRELNNTKKIKLINCARNTKLKNQSFLINIVNYLVNKLDLKNFHLEILGDGPLNKELIKKVNKLKLNNHIKIIGKVNNVEDYYKKSDIYLHSGLDAIFGLSTIEAMCSGLPIIGLKGNSSDRIIRHGTNALICENNNIVKFTELLLKLVNEKNIYNEMSKQNLELSKSFSIDNYAKKIYELYKESISSIN